MLEVRATGDDVEMRVYNRELRVNSQLSHLNSKLLNSHLQTTLNFQLCGNFENRAPTRDKRGCVSDSLVSPKVFDWVTFRATSAPTHTHKKRRRRAPKSESDPVHPFFFNFHNHPKYAKIHVGGIYYGYLRINEFRGE